MRPFAANKTCFGRNLDEYMDNTIIAFETLAEMFEVADEEKLKRIPVMLKGDALRKFSKNGRSCTNFEEAL